MQITNYTPNFTGRTIIINPKENSHIKYIHNKVVDLISDPAHRLPTLISEKEIKIDGATDYPKNINIVVEKLKEIGIKFTEIIK